jgi:hypothetical protein
MRPSMTEAEFERRLSTLGAAPEVPPAALASGEPIDLVAGPPEGEATRSGTRSRTPRSKPAKSRRVQRMFAIEEDVDKKLWLYAIHVGKDRSEVVNDLLRPVVASMVLYDSRDRRGARNTDLVVERGSDLESDPAS